MRLLPLLATLFLSGCTGDETVAGYGAADRIWVLEELDGSPFPAHATLLFPETGKIAGEAPCNRYSGMMTAPYPWFGATQVVSTRKACPDLEAEAKFFDALSDMTLSEVLGNVMILSNDAGREMVFKSVD
ncbi:MAG: META domain-containing protein [Paracoccaceae bacterium]